MRPDIIAQAVHAPLNLAVAAVGIPVFSLGALGTFRPSSLIALVEHTWSSLQGIGLILVIRASVGVLLIAAASVTLYPKIIFVLGVLALVKAISIPLLGHTRRQTLLKWWCKQPARYLRGWSLLASAFGLFLTYAAVSARDVTHTTTAK